MSNLINYITLIYTTNKKKKIQVYFFEDDQAWFNTQQIATLFNTTNEEIDKATNNIPKSDYPKSPYMEFQLIENGKMNIVNWNLIKLVGEIINPEEVKELHRWITLMTEEHDKNVSDEFNNNLNQILNQKPSSQN